MRRIIAGLMLGSVVMGSAAGAAVVNSARLAPMQPAEFGQINNRAVLGLAASQGDQCTPDSAGKGCEGLGSLDGNALPVIAGVGAVAIGVAIAAGSGGSGGSDNSGNPSSP